MGVDNVIYSLCKEKIKKIHIILAKETEKSLKILLEVLNKCKEEERQLWKKQENILIMN